MKTKNAVTTPVIEIEITKENYARAVRSSSGSCLIADAIKEKYPHLHRVDVDTATIRVTDRERGERFVYLTPRSIGETLLFFDQGWPEDEKSLPKKFLIRRAVKILPIVAGRKTLEARAKHRAARVAELEAKEQTGETLTDGEKRTLGRLRNHKSVERPTARGPAEAEGTGRNLVIRGGSPPATNKHNPNLLHRRNRIFGAKTAKPSQVFEQAVEEAVKERLEEALAKKEQEATLAEVTAS